MWKSFYENYQKYIVIFSAFLLNLSVGSFYDYSNAMRSCGNNQNAIDMCEHGNGNRNKVFVLSAGLLGFSSSIYLAAFLLKKFKPMLVSLIAALLASLCVMLMSFICTLNLVTQVINYGLFDGFFSGIVYGVTIDVAYKWFPKRIGTVSGIFAATFPLSSLVFTKAQIDMNRMLPKSKTVEYSYIVMACVYIIMQVISAVFIRYPTVQNTEEEISISASTSSNVNYSISESLMYHDEDRDGQPHKVFRTLNFWSLWLTSLLLTTCFGLAIASQKPHTSNLLAKVSNETEEHEDGFGSGASHGLVVFVVGVIFWGAIIDKYRYKTVIRIKLAAIALLFLSCLIPILNHKINILVYYYIWVELLYFFSSGSMSIYACMCAKVFGKTHFIENYGMLFTAWAIVSAVFYLFAHFSNVFKLYHYKFLIGCVCAVLAMLITFTFKERRSHQ